MSGSSSAHAETVIVGGGVIGLSLAYELLRRRRGVLVVDGAREGAATAAAAGMLAPISEAETERPELVAFGQDSLARFPGFVADLERVARGSCGYLEEGTLWVALDRDEREELDRLQQNLERKGLVARPLGAAEVQRLEPHLSGRIVAGLLIEQDQQVDPRALCRCLAQAVEALGGTIARGLAVEEIERAREGFVLRGRGPSAEPFELAAARVVVAAGAWSAGLALPLARLGLRPVKGQLLRLAGVRLLRHVVRSPEAYLVPRQDGELLVGATMEEMGWDTAPTAGAVMELLRHGWEMLPGIYELKLAEVSVGLRSAVDDHLPVIGESEVRGLFLALGHYRNGVLLAPATAHYLARWLDEGAAPAELAPFVPQRLSRGAPAPRAG